jgi:hypothetical protein
MPIKENITNMIKKNSLRAFKTLARGKGVSKCKYYPAISGTTQVIKRNLYHDVIEDTGPGKVNGIETYIYIDMALPAKEVKALGWWKEDDTLPIVGYMPVEEGWVPQDSALIEVGPEEGYLSGTYRVKKSTQYGQGIPCLWVINLVPKRV